MTVAGSGAWNTSTRSASPAGGSASIRSWAICSMRGASSAVRRGVKAAEASRRRRVCAGESASIIRAPNLTEGLWRT